jgi:exodeoxyribonuclease-3
MDFEGAKYPFRFWCLVSNEFVFASGTNAERLGHKFMYMDDFQNYITELKKEIPNLVIWVITIFAMRL